MTLAETILSRAAGRRRVAPGDVVWPRLALAMATDITAPLAVDAFRRTGAGRVFDRRRVVLVEDHLVPARDATAARLVRGLRRFAARQGVVHHLAEGFGGICHVAVPDLGLVAPGTVSIGADSHTCAWGALGAFCFGAGSADVAAAWAIGKTWIEVPPTFMVRFVGRRPRWIGGKDLALRLIGQIGASGALGAVIEFAGPAVASLGMDDRFALCTMAVEAGAVTGIIAPDRTTGTWLAARGARPRRPLGASAEAACARTVTIDVTGMTPMVAAPHSPANARPAAAFEGVRVDRVVIGSCVNGRLGDMRNAARVLGGRRVHPRVRLTVVPGSDRVAAAMEAEGIAGRLRAAGAEISPPVCGPCLGARPWALPEGATGLYTTPRNFAGRHGAVGARVYLAGPAVAAETAVRGVIAAPREA